MDVAAHPLTILGACALTLVGALLLYFSVRREMAVLRAGLAAEHVKSFNRVTERPPVGS